MQSYWIKMKTPLAGIAIMLTAAAVFGGEIKVKDSDTPILQILEMKPDLAEWRPDRPAFKSGGKPLLTIRSIRDLIVQPDGKEVLMVLNENDSKKYAELTRKFQGRLLFFQLSDKPMVGDPASSAPNEEGIIPFREASAEYLRRRFGK
jgi:hypothetical protein